MAAVLEEMTDGVLIVAEDGRVQLVNSAIESMFEVRSAHVVGKSLIEALRNHQIQELIEACRRSGETVAGVVEITGRGLYLQCIAKPLGHPMPGSILLLFQNLTRMRRLETVRQDFVSNISHELRTPLASLKALTETLQDGALDDPPAARDFLARMETEVDALSQMVEELLELTRIESGRTPLKLAPTSAERLLRTAVERLSVQAERRGLQLELDCPDDLPLILADFHRLEQVVVNLLHNAIKFTPPGGRVTLSARLSGEEVRFDVADTGIGIQVEDLERIFERFFKSDRARTGGGVGLGLAIARHMVEAHGGRIWAESREGQGSTFSFTIPVGE
jgi:two-component system phosphate regulon sensor histidine kinase PhoR